MIKFSDISKFLLIVTVILYSFAAMAETPEKKGVRFGIVSDIHHDILLV